MWIFTIICLIGMVIFFVFACVITLTHTEIESWLRLGIAFTVLPMVIGMVSFLAVTSILDEELKKNKKEKIEYEPITFTVYKEK